MSPYLLSIYFLFVAALSHALAGVLALQSWALPGQTKPRRRMWLAFSLGTMLLALHHGDTLSLAAQTGLYDFRQATLAMLAGLLNVYAILQLRRPA